MLKNLNRVNYINGISLDIKYTKQIKCLILKLCVMKTFYSTLFGILFTVSLFSQISYDTTYSKEWNKKTESWMYFDRIISSYDNGIIASESIQVYDFNDWANYSFKEYHYNNGRLIEELEKYWNDKKESWDNNYRKLYSYNDQGNVSNILHQYIFNDNYVNSSKEIYKYSFDGKLLEKEVENFEQAWTKFLKYQYYYNRNDLIMEENLTYWSDESWGDVDFIVKYSYDNQDRLVNKIKSKTNGTKNKNLIQEEFVFGDNGRLEEHIISEWGQGRKKWIPTNRAVYESSLNGYIASALNQNKNKSAWDNYLFTEFNGNNEPITGLDITEGMSFSIYPINYGRSAKIEFSNPYSETYFVKILNENGELVGSATTKKNEVAVNASKFGKGMYFVELQGSYLYSGSFSIE